MTTICVNVMMMVVNDDINNDDIVAIGVVDWLIVVIDVEWLIVVVGVDQLIINDENLGIFIPITLLCILAFWNDFLNVFPSY